MSLMRIIQRDVSVTWSVSFVHKTIITINTELRKETDSIEYFQTGNTGLDSTVCVENIWRMILVVLIL